MNCREFRANYSDFTDGLLDERTEAAARRHLAECGCCRRMNAAYQAGRGMLRGLPRLSPSREFALRLAERLHRDGGPEPALRQFSGAAAALLILATMTLLSLEVRARGELARAAEAAADTLILLVPGASADPAIVRVSGDSLWPVGDPFDPFPTGTSTFVAGAAMGPLASYASLTSR